MANCPTASPPIGITDASSPSSAPSSSEAAIADSAAIRRAALQHKVPYTTTIAGAEATCMALKQLDILSVNRLQDLY